MDEPRTAVVGGTFSPLHNGHRALLHEAFRTASRDGAPDDDGRVLVGITSRALAERTRSDPDHAALLGSIEDRRETLRTELDRVAAAYAASYEVLTLTDVSGPAGSRDDVHVLVVSPEAKAQRRAYEVNRRRVAEGRRPLEIDTAPFVVAEDGTRISGTRIRNGEIDADGRVLDS